MNFPRIYALFVRQIFLIKNNPIRLVGTFLWLILDIVMWGFITRYLGSLGQTTFSFVTVVLGAVILWEFTTRIQQGMLGSFLEDMWAQNFINYFASPLAISEYIGGLVLTSIVTGIVGLGIMLVLAGLFFGYNLFKIGLLLFPFLLILFVFGIAMGALVTALIFRLGPSAEWMAWPIPMVLSIFTGVFYPIATLPGPLHAIARALPPTYVFENVRSILSTGSFSTPELVLAFLLAVGYLLLVYWFFVRVYRHNVRHGAIARFNAEST